MSKFGSVFKSLDTLRVTAENNQTVAKAADEAVEKSAIVRPLGSPFAGQKLAKALRDGGDTIGFCKAVHDQRYDHAIFTTLSKCGATDASALEFMQSRQGYNMGLAMHSKATKVLGLPGVVRKSFEGWKRRTEAPASTPEPIRKSATEFLPES